MPSKASKYDRLLSNVSVKYKAEGAIHMDIAPEVAVKRTKDDYRIWDRNFRIPETKRADKGLARQHTWEFSTGAYNLENHALVDWVSQDEKDNFDETDYRADTVEELTDKIQMRKERSIADLFTTTSFSNGVSLAATAIWTLDTTVSNPIPMFDTGTSVVMLNAGIKPNWAVIPRDSFVAAKNHSSVVERVKYTSRELDENILAGLLGMPNLFVPYQPEDTGPEGGTSSIGSIFTTDFVLMGFSPSRPGPKTISTFYQFKKNAPAVRTWTDNDREGAEAIEVGSKHQFKVIASLTAYYINNSI